MKGKNTKRRQSDIEKLVDVGKLSENKITYTNPPSEFRVLGETEEYYVVQKEGGKIGAVEKDKARVVIISGYIT